MESCDGKPSENSSSLDTQQSQKIDSEQDSALKTSVNGNVESKKDLESKDVGEEQIKVSGEDQTKLDTDGGENLKKECEPKGPANGSGESEDSEPWPERDEKLVGTVEDALAVGTTSLVDTIVNESEENAANDGTKDLKYEEIVSKRFGHHTFAYRVLKLVCLCIMFVFLTVIGEVVSHLLMISFTKKCEQNEQHEESLKTTEEL